MSDSTHQDIRPPVPPQYAGQWVAWDHERTRLIASGPTWEQAFQAARASGEKQPYLERALDDEGFVGHFS